MPSTKIITDKILVVKHYFGLSSNSHNCVIFITIPRNMHGAGAMLGRTFIDWRSIRARSGGNAGGLGMGQGRLVVGQCARRMAVANAGALAPALCWWGGRWSVVGGRWLVVGGRWSVVYTIVDVVINIPAPLSGGGAVGRGLPRLVKV